MTHQPRHPRLSLRRLHLILSTENHVAVGTSLSSTAGVRRPRRLHDTTALRAAVSDLLFDESGPRGAFVAFVGADAPDYLPADLDGFELACWLQLGSTEPGALRVLLGRGDAVDDAKAEALAALGVPWVEVRADEALLAINPAWTLDAPLLAHRIGPASRWRCASHRAARQAAPETEAREREAARHTRRVCAVRLVDIRYPSGTLDRSIYRVVEESTDGVPHTIVLERNRDTLLKLPLAAAAKRVLWARIEAMYAVDVRGITAKRGAGTDCAME